jgi:uncharacterized protein (TIGR03492 family)
VSLKRLLVVSNGYGEDLEVAQVLQALPLPALAVSAYPLVGLGQAYPAGVSLLDPRREFPSGGFGMRAGWASLWMDLSHGWLRFWLAQRRTLQSQRGAVDLVVAAGDVYCLVMASAAGGPTVFLELPRSEYIAPHSALELWLIRRVASQVFTRDEVTAAALRRRGVPAQCFGFTLMDTLALSGEGFGLPGDGVVLTLLPGSKPPAFDNLVLLLRASAAASRATPDLAVLLAWAPHLSRARLRETVESAGGVWVDPHRFRFETIEVVVTSDHYADALDRATVVLGMAGAAHEQAAGLGKPVVAFPGTGPQFTPRFLGEQQRLLGDALIVTGTWQEAARAVTDLLRDPRERERRGRVGRERQGEAGAASAIARYLLERLSA